MPSQLLDHAPIGDLFPGDAGLEAMAEAAMRTRMSTLFGLGMLLSHRDLIDTEQVKAFEELHRRPLGDRARVVSDPVVRIWLRRSLAIANRLVDHNIAPTDDDTSHLARFADVVSLALQNPPLTVHGARLVRHEADPLLKAVAPPTYVFPAVTTEAQTAYSVEFFADFAHAALARTAVAWPELHAAIPRFVRLVVHVPDGTFRSASAARYAGAVFFSADDHSLFDLEESIVHEFGHQILYAAMELDPLVAAGSDDVFVLPWSGSERDWYGFFHAFFIYVLLAEYFTRRLDIAVGVDPSPDWKRVHARRAEVLAGIESALPQICGGALTDGGHRVVATLQRRIERLGAHTSRLAR